jgi:flagellum-specific ATP synthase
MIDKINDFLQQDVETKYGFDEVLSLLNQVFEEEEDTDDGS